VAAGATSLEIETPHGPARAHVHAVAGARAALVLGHGAGGGVTSRDLAAAARAALGERVTVPAPAGQLDAAWIAVVAALRAGPLRGLPLVAGGRSSGARVACRTAAETGATGVVCLAFPLRPPRRSGSGETPTRLPELAAVPVPVLVVQGARDPFGVPPPGPRRTVVEVAGDHSLRSDLAAVTAAVEHWLADLLDGAPPGT
jgi:predicted alpha/beta-hydrolase family hydrolase